MEMKNCPFCGEEGMDLVGLKFHLLNHCTVFESTKDVVSLMGKNTRAPASPWVSVKDRLPDVIGHYLIFLSYCGSKQISWAFYNSEKKWCGEGYYDTVTHWQPLPEPPKESL